MNPLSGSDSSNTPASVLEMDVSPALATNERAGSWVTLLVLFSAAALVETLFWGQLNAFTPLHLRRLGIAPEQLALWTGITSSVAIGLGLPLLPLWGALADRYARKPLITRSFVVYVAAAVLTACAADVWTFTLGRALMCLSLGNTGLMMTLLAERTPIRRIAFAFSVLNAAGPIGAFIGPLVGGPLVDLYGLPGLLLIDGALLLLVTLALQLGYRDDFVCAEVRPLSRMVLDSLRSVWASPAIVILPALFLLFAGWIMANTFVPLSIDALHGQFQRATAIGLVLGGGGLATLIIAPAVGMLADRWGLWRALLAAALVEVPLWLLPPLFPGLVGFAVSWSLVNGVASGVFAVAFTILAATAPVAARGRVMSFAYLPVNIGAFAGAALGAPLCRWSTHAIFPAAAVLTAFGFCALLLARGRIGPLRREL